MKKQLITILILLMALTLVSCVTKAGTEIPPVSRIVEIDDADYPENLLWDFICIYADGMFGNQNSLQYVKNDEAKTITVNGFTFDSNVGFAAQNGDVEIRIDMEVKERKAICTINYIDSFGYLPFGPIKKKVSQGMTALGQKEYDYNCQLLLDAFENAILIQANNQILHETLNAGIPQEEITEDIMPVKLELAEFGKEIEDGSIVGNLVRTNQNTWLQIDGISDIYAIDKNIHTLGTAELYNDEFLFLKLNTKNENPETMCIIYPHSKKGNWDISEIISYFPAVTDFLDSEYYDTYTILIPSNLTDFKPGYYDVVITDDLNFSPAYYMVLEFKKRPDGLKYK